MRATARTILGVAVLAWGPAACSDGDTKTIIQTEIVEVPTEVPIEVPVEVIPPCEPAHPNGVCDEGESCFQGACVDSATLCSTTNATGTCPSGMTCFSGGCVVATSLCQDSNPTGVCGSGETCLAGDCVAVSALCSPTNDSGLCPEDTTCFAGGCVVDNALCQAGQATGLCEVGSTCLDGECVFTNTLCSTSNPTGLCSGELACVDGICTKDEPEIDPCTVEVYSTQPVIGAHTAVTTKAIITVDGLQFKDSNGSGALEPFEDWRLRDICRARDLVTRMTVPQKVGLMSEGSRVGSGTADGTIPENVRAAIVDKHERYALIRLGSRSAQELATYLNNVQELAEGTTHGIPVTITADPVHGFGLSTDAATGAQTVSASTIVSPWPYPLGLGAINDPKVTAQYGDVVRREFMAMGFRWQLGPMADLATEPRWARVQNTFGSLAIPVSTHTAACIAAFQGSATGDIRNGIAATMKHFPGAGPNEDGKDSHSYAGRYNVFPGGWFAYHQISFQAAIDVGAASVMPCYSIFKDQWEYDPMQVAAAFSGELITDYMKEEMGFSGMVTGDWGTLGHGYNAETLTLAQRAALWLAAGSHQLGSDSEANFQNAYDLGLVTEADIDGAASKILEMTFKLGLFENPYVDPANAAVEVRSAANRTAGFVAQKKAIVMLKNVGHEMVTLPNNQQRRFLPLDGTRFVDANANTTPDPGEFIHDTDGDGTVRVYFDGVIDGIVAAADKPDYMTDLLGEYNYTVAASATQLPIVATTDITEADFAILRITARKGVYFGLDAGVPLSFDGPFPGTSTDSTIAAAIKDRNRVIDALRVRDGYTNAALEEVAATNPTLRIILVMHMDRPGIVRPFVAGLVNIDETPGATGPSYPLVSNVANIDPTGKTGVDALLVEFGAIDRAVLDFVFNKNVPENWVYGRAILPMELPSSDAAVEAQFEDVPEDTVAPTYRLGTSMTY